MLFCFLAFSVFAVLSTAQTVPRSIDEHDLTDEFRAFKATFGKEYSSTEEESKRFSLFRMRFYELIDMNTKIDATTTHGTNFFMDLTQEELDEMFPPMKIKEIEREFTRTVFPTQFINFSVFSKHLQSNNKVRADLRPKLGPIKNQGSCGSCYSFSAVATFDTAIDFAGKSKQIFSEMDVVMCWPNGGCKGGSTRSAMVYLNTNGLVLQDNFPYSADMQTSIACSSLTRHHANKFQPIVIQRANGADVKAFIQNEIGITTLYMYADAGFKSLRKGVYKCPTEYGSINHAINIVGYDVDPNAGEYWIVRNSWNTWWGDQGYGLLGIGSCDSSSYEYWSVLYDNCSEFNGQESKCNKHCHYCTDSKKCLLITENCPPDFCDSGVCCDTANQKLRPSSTVCRAATGDCDVPEYCTGNSPHCPSDVIKTAGTVCRPSKGVCDIEEVCDGKSRSCPKDTLSSSGTVCRAQSGECDVAEVCDGKNPACPQDSLRPAGYVCRPAIHPICDIAEVCDGKTKSCPHNAFSPKTTVCRAAGNQCEADSKCTGTGTCQPIMYKSAGTKCDDGNECTNSDECNGNGECAGKYFCECDSDDNCDNKNPCMSFKCSKETRKCEYTGLPTSTLCRPAENVCDSEEYCNEFGECPPNSFNQTCLDELSIRVVEQEDGKSKFPIYAIVLICVGILVFIVVIAFVLYRIKKNRDDQDNGVFGQLEEQGSSDAPPPTTSRFSLRRPISVRMNVSAVPSGYKPVAQPNIHPESAPTRALPTPPRAQRMSIRARPVSTKLSAPPLPPRNGPPRNGPSQNGASQNKPSRPMPQRPVQQQPTQQRPAQPRPMPQRPAPQQNSQRPPRPKPQ